MIAVKAIVVDVVWNRERRMRLRDGAALQIDDE
jgi:hypothetical protein